MRYFPSIHRQGTKLRNLWNRTKENHGGTETQRKPKDGKARRDEEEEGMAEAETQLRPSSA